MSNEELQAIENWAGLALSMDEVGILVQADETKWKEAMTTRGEAWKAYQRGYLKLKAEANKVVIDLAMQGSAPAQKELLGMIANIDNYNL